MSSCNDIRESFLNYFATRNHEIVPGSTLVPGNDPSLLFTNSGMVQFKDMFSGKEVPVRKRAASVQRCVRAGGKHNDLEHVGHTARHHTFFEMLGNFSFGDYFKEQAIHYAWDYLTKTLQIPDDRLWITTYEKDQESAEIWQKMIGIPKTRLSNGMAQDNFWSMGETGPCGPCTEIYYDHGPTLPGGPPGSQDQEGERYVEIWNLVFTQYVRNEQGTLQPIPHPSVDTGMGLERIAAILQGVHNNYDIDLFQALISRLRALAGNPDIVSMKVVADHIRTASFLICDGVLPSNEGRGYVLRRIIRRAIRHGHTLDIKGPFLHRLLPKLCETMGDFYAFLHERKQTVEKTLQREEERFGQTLEHGLKLMMELLESTTDQTIPGEDAFRLYDTYGFPLDLTADIAREHGKTIDEKAFNEAMAMQKKRARQASRFTNDDTSMVTASSLSSAFSGYIRLEQKTTVIELYHDGQQVTTLEQGDSGGIILPETPFYARAGGQVGDRGEITTENGGYFDVEDTRLQTHAYIHLGILRAGTLQIGDVVVASVAPGHRARVTRNHSATHLLHAALRKLLGEHVVQKGSLVAADRLRFDFSHHKPLSLEQIEDLERIVNSCILQNVNTIVQHMSLQEAKQSGALMLCGEKYAEKVRVLTIGDELSKELCGGTHVAQCGEIGLFKIISETGIAAEVRRIEACTGDLALNRIQENDAKLKRIAGVLKTTGERLEDKLSQQLGKLREMEKEVSRLRNYLVNQARKTMLDTAIEVTGVKVLAQCMEGADAKTLKDTVQQLRTNNKRLVAILATISSDGKVNLAAGVSEDSMTCVRAVDLIQHVAVQIGGRGGGRADFAQAGSDDPSALPQALHSVTEWVRKRLNTEAGSIEQNR